MDFPVVDLTTKSTPLTEWVNQHSYHPATPETAPLHDQIRQHCIRLAQSIDRVVPEGFERDEAQKALQLVRMWSNAGIAIRLASPATVEQRTAPNDPLGQDHGHSDTAVVCHGCDMAVTLRDKAVNGSLNPHWGPDDRYTCRAS